MHIEFRPQVKLLLRKTSEESVKMAYLNHRWTVPRMTERPPYYANPQYEVRYPVI